MSIAISSATTALPVRRPDNDGDNDARVAKSSIAEASERTPSAPTASKGATVNAYA